MPFWKLLSYNGTLELNTEYSERTVKNQTDDNIFYGGELLVNTRSYLYHPNLITLNIGGSYINSKRTIGEESQLSNYINKNNGNSFYLNTQIFKRIKTKMSTFMSFRDYNTNNNDLVFTSKKEKLWGGQINYATNTSGFNFRFEQSDLNEVDLNSNRTYAINKSSINSSYEKSFYVIDFNRLSYDLLKFVSNKGQESENTNTQHSLIYSGNTPFDKDKKISLNSYLSTRFIDYTKNITSFNFSASENLLVNLNENLLSESKFNLSAINFKDTRNNSYNASTRLRHLLYKSVISTVDIDYRKSKSLNNFEMNTLTRGLNIRYIKKIPLIKGNIQISYYNTLNAIEKIGSDNNQNIYEERHSLEDGVITLLDNVNPIKETIIVKDALGAFTYEENIDYILITVGKLIEIQRLASGIIPNKGTVSIDYVVNQNDSYTYNAISKSFRSKLSFYKDLIQIFYNKGEKTNESDEDLSNLSLNEYQENEFGAIVNYKTMRLSTSYKNYNSSLYPYKLINAHFSLRQSLSENMFLNIDGLYFNYLEYLGKTEKRQQISFSSNFQYRLSRSSKMTLSVNYFNQIFGAENSNLISTRAGFYKTFNQVKFALDLTYYNRLLTNSNDKYLGATLRIIRKF